jgi:hypothetical protein
VVDGGRWVAEVLAGGHQLEVEQLVFVECQLEDEPVLAVASELDLCILIVVACPPPDVVVADAAGFEYHLQLDLDRRQTFAVETPPVSMVVDPDSDSRPPSPLMNLLELASLHVSIPA